MCRIINVFTFPSPRACLYDLVFFPSFSYSFSFNLDLLGFQNIFCFFSPLLRFLPSLNHYFSFFFLLPFLFFFQSFFRGGVGGWVVFFFSLSYIAPTVFCFHFPFALSSSFLLLLSSLLLPLSFKRLCSSTLNIDLLSPVCLSLFLPPLQPTPTGPLSYPHPLDSQP